jgi:hypothetical protein
MLAHRARVESDAMRELLVAQERSIRTELAQHRAQLPLELTDPRERAAWLADTQAMTDRLPVARQARQARQARPRRPRAAPLTARSIRPAGGVRPGCGFTFVGRQPRLRVGDE